MLYRTLKEGIIMLIKLIYRTFIIYVLVFALLKFMGKREIGQLSLFDLVVILVIADLSVMGIETIDIPFFYFIFPVIGLALIQKGLAFALIRLPKIRKVFDGEHSLIINNGVLNQEEMRKQNYNINDLVLQLRINNIRSISEVKYALLETNGDISIFTFEDFTNTGNSSNSGGGGGNTKGAPLDFGGPSSPKNAVQSQQPKDIYPFPVILSGVINTENLDTLQLSTKWLMKELKKQGYDDYQNILYANYENKSLFIIEMENPQNKKTKKKQNSNQSTNNQEV